MSSRRTLFVVATLLIATVLLGCPLMKKKKATPADDDDDLNAAMAALADAATVAVTGTGAKNEGSVLRYANEERIANEPAVIGRDGTKVRQFPGNGPEIVTLNKGTAVVKVAKYFSTGVLVEFADPAAPGNLLGWVGPNAFAAPGVAATSKPVVVPTTAPTVVTTVTPPKAVDAGASPLATPTKDAGSTPSVATGDAGAAKSDDPWSPANLKFKIATPPIDGKCPTSYSLILGSCRRLCKADADCVRGTFCVQKPFSPQNKFCSTDK